MMQASQRSLLPVTAEEGGVRTRAFFGRVSDGAREAFSQRKPWAEMVDRNSFSKPASVSEAGARISNNLSYFRVNYVILVVAGICVSFLTQPVSLVVLLALLGAWIFLYLLRSEPLVLFGRSFGEREVLGMMLLLTVVVVFLTDVGSLLIWSLMVGAAGIVAHAALRAGQAEDLFMDQPQPPDQAGFLSFLGTRTPSIPVPASHV